MHGLPGIALSQSMDIPVYDAFKERGRADETLLSTLRASARHAAQLAPELAAQTARAQLHRPQPQFPLPVHAGFAAAAHDSGQGPPSRALQPQSKDGTHRLVFRLGEDTSARTPLTDRSALDAGFISHTVLDFSKLGSI